MSFVTSYYNYPTAVTSFEKIEYKPLRNALSRASDMTDNLDLTADNLENNSDPVTAGDIAEVIEEFERYRQRLIDDLTAAAQKAKLPKSKLTARLEPELAQIDATLENLRARHAEIIGV